MHETLEPSLDPTFDPTLNPSMGPSTDTSPDQTGDSTLDSTSDTSIDPSVDPSLDPSTDPSDCEMICDPSGIDKRRQRRVSIEERRQARRQERKSSEERRRIETTKHDENHTYIERSKISFSGGALGEFHEKPHGYRKRLKGYEYEMRQKIGEDAHVLKILANVGDEAVNNLVKPKPSSRVLDVRQVGHSIMYNLTGKRKSYHYPIATDSSIRSTPSTSSGVSTTPTSTTKRPGWKIYVASPSTTSTIKPQRMICVDTKGWTNGLIGCNIYRINKWCEDRAFVPGSEWTGSRDATDCHGHEEHPGQSCAERFNFPAENCCICGKKADVSAAPEINHEPPRKADAYVVYKDEDKDYPPFNITNLDFIHIAKNGGTSIINFGEREYEQFWGKKKTWKTNGNVKTYAGKSCRYPWHVPPKYFPYNAYPRPYNFCIVRHPVTRITSEFKYRQKTGRNAYSRDKFYDEFSYDAVGFNDFISKAIRSYEKNRWIADCHIMPAWQYIYDDYGKRTCHFVLKLEYLEEGMEKLGGIFGFNGTLSLKSNPSKRKNDTRYDITEENFKRLRKLYRHDFDLYQPNTTFKFFDIRDLKAVS